MCATGCNFYVNVSTVSPSVAEPFLSVPLLGSSISISGADSDQDYNSQDFANSDPSPDPS